MIELEINFRPGGNSRRFTRKGFSVPENFGTWMTGPKSSVLLPPPPRVDCAFHLTVVVGPSLRPPVLTSQRFAVSVNGVELESLVLTGVRSIECDVPPSVIAAGVPIEITFAHPDAISPARLDGHGDLRELAASIWSLTMVGRDTQGLSSAGGAPRALADPFNEPTLGDPPVFQMRAKGGLANRMIQYMVAISVQSRVPGCLISGAILDEWGVKSEEVGPDWSDEAVFTEQHLDVDAVAEMLRGKTARKVVYHGYGQRMENLLPVTVYREIFKSDITDVEYYDERFLVIHIRAGDIVHGTVPHYVLTPLSYYDDLIRETGLQPVFLGQLDPNHYIDALRARFPNALFAPSQPPMRDFETLRRSKNIAIAVSTFSWLAAWLSHANRIFMPINGLLNPIQYPGVDLLPANDARYQFYLFPINYAALPDQLAEAHQAMDGKWQKLDAAALADLRERAASLPADR